VYPNPAKSIVTIESNCESNYYIEIYNVNGKLIGNYSSVKKKTNLNISHLKTGVYIYKVYSKTGIISSGKFIKY